MDYDPNLVNVDLETSKLRKWEKNGFRPSEIAEVRDDTFRRLFGFTPEELVRPIAKSKQIAIKYMYYQEAMAFARERGFDLGVRREHHGVPLPYQTGEFWYDEYGDLIWVPDENQVRPTVVTPESHGRITRYWREIIEMIVAKEDGLLPTTPEQIAAVELQREAREAARRNARGRERTPDRTSELEKVFGRSRQLREGMIEGRTARGDATSPVKVEVLRSRRFRPGTPKR